MIYSNYLAFETKILQRQNTLNFLSGEAGDSAAVANSVIEAGSGFAYKPATPTPTQKDTTSAPLSTLSYTSSEPLSPLSEKMALTPGACTLLTSPSETYFPSMTQRGSTSKSIIHRSPSLGFLEEGVSPRVRDLRSGSVPDRSLETRQQGELNVTILPRKVADRRNSLNLGGGLNFTGLGRLRSRGTTGQSSSLGHVEDEASEEPMSFEEMLGGKGI